MGRKLKTPPPASVGANVRRLREALGLRQEDLASRAGVSMALVYALESKDRGPTLRSAHRIALALGVTLDDLVSGVRPHAN